MIKNILNNKLKKVSVAFVATLLIVMGNPLAYAIALTVPTAPSSPTAPASPSAPSGSTVPSVPSSPTAPTNPTAPEAPLSPEPGPVPVSEVTPPPPPQIPETPDSSVDTDTQPVEDGPAATNSQESQTQGGGDNSFDTDQTGGLSGDSVVGGSSVASGDATSTSLIENDLNTNSLNNPSDSASVSETGSVSVATSDNGSGSSNSGSVSLTEGSDTSQTNGAVIKNDLTQSATTGDNSASRNTGGENTIVSGDANTTGTIINSVNTNLAGVAVYEFNINDNHMGDYILDFNSANCISGCDVAVDVANSGNGDNSENNLDVNLISDNSTFQSNDADVENNMTLIADSGDNQADSNTAGNSTITTGDANVSANALTFANNNLAGNVVYAVVNIFGDLIGDILLPDGSILGCCGQDAKVVNSGNADGSDNNLTFSQTTNEDISQFNLADIDNNLILSAETGDNSTSSNTNGDNSITTGDSSIVASVVNFANMNIAGGNWWLVLVNEGGRWIGKILGAPDGSDMYASQGIDIYYDDNGEILVTNTGNGSNSTNNLNINQENNTEVNQENNAHIVNNLNLSANTGGNSASRNVGGDNSITTGDASVIANIVNFVNNNIIGNGKLLVTAINVFGSWIGDFVGPGYGKVNENDYAVGGASNQESQNDYNDSGLNEVLASNTESGDNSVTQDGSADVTGETQIERKTGVLSMFTRGGSSITMGSEEEESSEEEQPIFASGSNDKSAGDKVVNINLAWFLFIIPFVGILMIAKKKYQLLRLLPLPNKGNV